MPATSKGKPVKYADDWLEKTMMTRVWKISMERARASVVATSLMLLLLGATAVGCGRAAHDTTTAPPAKALSHVPQPSRDALVYGAVIGKLVDTSNVAHVYVLDGAVPSAGDPMKPTERPTRPFSAGLKHAISIELKQLPVTFVSTRSEVIAGSSPGHIADGVLITLGPITWISADTAVVANNRWASGLNGQWMTYQVQRRGSGWRIAGPSPGSPVAMS